MATFREPAAAVIAARARRGSRRGGENVRIEWFIRQFQRRLDLTMTQRVRVAVRFVETRVVKNISKAVTKGVGPRGGRVVRDRSHGGEFPRAETTQLLKSIFSGVNVTGNLIRGFIGVPLDYGVILETRMDRSFLERTLREERSRVRRLLTRRIS